MGYQARASLHPGDFTERGFGFLVANDNLTSVMPVSPATLGLDHVNLKLVGLFGTYAASSWKILATAYHAEARLYYTFSAANDRFDVGYIQAEQRMKFDLTGFLRWEDSIGTAQSPYLKLFDEFARTGM